MQLELSKTKVKLIDYNPRSEFHGKDIKHAGDLMISVDMSNDCLAAFHPALKSLLYHYDQSIDADLVDQSHSDDPSYRPHIRMPHLSVPLKWTDSMIGATVTVHHGVKSEIDLKLCNIDNLKIEPKQGGTVTLSFKIAAHPDEKQSGKLCTMIQTDIEISIAPPESTQQDIDQEK